VALSGGVFGSGRICTVDCRIEFDSGGEMGLLSGLGAEWYWYEGSGWETCREDVWQVRSLDLCYTVVSYMRDGFPTTFT